MFYDYPYQVSGQCRPGGRISDYSLVEPMKNKSIDFYVQDVPMILAEATLHNKLFAGLPKGLPYGIRTRVWSQFFPNVAFMGEMVGYNTYNELGEAVITLSPAETFDMNTVPWADIIS